MLYQYDARAEKCPLPLVNLRVLLKKMSVGDSCIIQISDAGSKSDIPNLLTRQGYPFKKIFKQDYLEIHIQHR